MQDDFVVATATYNSVGANGEILAAAAVVMVAATLVVLTAALVIQTATLVRVGTLELAAIYWGNYLSRIHLEKLGGDAFLSGFRETARIGYDYEGGLLWEFENGVFLALSLDPIIERDEGGALAYHSLMNANWLIKELGERGFI